MNGVVILIGKVGFMVVFVVLIILVICYFVIMFKRVLKWDRGVVEVIKEMVYIFLIVVMIVVVVVFEGLLLVVMFILVYFMCKMMVDKLLVCVFVVCEIMGFVIIICSDKMGIFIFNKMIVICVCIGGEDLLNILFFNL